MPKLKKEKGSTRVRKSELIRNISTIFIENSENAYNFKQISTLLNIKSDSQRVFINQLLYQLVDEDFLTEISKGKFRLNSRGSYITGTIDRHGAKTYLIPEDGGETILELNNFEPRKNAEYFIKQLSSPGALRVARRHGRQKL